MSYITTNNLTNIMADLKDILEGEFFKDLSEGINGGEKRLQGCYHACGVK